MAMVDDFSDWQLGEYVETDGGYPVRVKKKFDGVVISVKQDSESHSHLTPDEADALAVMLQYAAKLAREGGTQ